MKGVPCRERCAWVKNNEQNVTHICFSAKRKNTFKVVPTCKAFGTLCKKVAFILLFIYL